MRARIVLLLGVAACNPYDDDLGPAPFLCGATEPRCPQGYECLADNGKDVCFESGSGGGDNCDDDGGLEPNDTLDVATASGLDTARTFQADNHTICPGIDKDNFGLALAVPNEAIDLTVEYQPADANLRAAILNATGIPITVASSGSSSTMLTAHFANLPSGTYYVQVSGPGGSLPTNSYKLTIAVSP